MDSLVLSDSSALVALISRSDRHHEWAKQTVAALSGALVTCEAALSETWFLLNGAGHLREAARALVDDGVIRIGMSLAEQWAPVSELLAKYASVPMSIADACMVRLSEMNPRAPLFTTDSDFLIYRRNRRERLPLIYPDIP
jgi:predicted nucleic acid-binding protein